MLDITTKDKLKINWGTMLNESGEEYSPYTFVTWTGNYFEDEAEKWLQLKATKDGKVYELPESFLKGKIIVVTHKTAKKISLNV